MNMVNFLESKADIQVAVYSTYIKGKKEKLFKGTTSKVYRLGTERPSALRYVTYFAFNVFSFLRLLFFKPDCILYYETYSCLPALWYKKLVKKTRLFIHYHEYLTAAEYNNGSKYLKWLHKQEIKIYSKTEWISHTNEKRMELFEKDLQMSLTNKFILPNYPPKSWLQETAIKETQFPLRIVYIGAIQNVHNISSREFAKWVEDQNGRVLWDVYSHQDATDFLKYLGDIKSKYTKFLGFVNYDELPNILKKYQVGVILYKGHIPNFVHNAPNKLFEYLAAGLDVWFSSAMDGCRDYITHNTFPRVLPVDFEHLATFDLASALDRNGFSYKESNFYSEYVFQAFFNTLTLQNQAPVPLPA